MNLYLRHGAFYQKNLPACGLMYFETLSPNYDFYFVFNSWHEFDTTSNKYHFKDLIKL